MNDHAKKILECIESVKSDPGAWKKLSTIVRAIPTEKVAPTALELTKDYDVYERGYLVTEFLGYLLRADANNKLFKELGEFLLKSEADVGFCLILLDLLYNQADINDERRSAFIEVLNEIG